MSRPILGGDRSKWIWQPKNSPCWHYDFVVRGERFTGSTGCTSRKKAERFARERREEAVGRHYANAVKTGVDGRPRDMTLNAAVCWFFEESGQYDVGSNNTFRLCMWLLDFFDETTLITRITDEKVAAMVAALRKKRINDDPERNFISDSYINMHVDLLERILRRARYRWKVPLPDEPFWKDHKLPEAPRTREMTAEELILLRENCRDDMWPVLEFTFQSALRKTNAVELKWKQVHWAEKVIRVVVKNDKPREVPITPEIEEILRAQQGKHREAVFTFKSTRTRACISKAGMEIGRRFVRGKAYPMTASNVSGYWRRLLKACGIDDLRIHDLRRTRGSLMLRATGNIAAVQELLHHADIKTTRGTYAHVTNDDVARAMAKTALYEAGLVKDAMAELERAARLAAEAEEMAGSD